MDRNSQFIEYYNASGKKKSILRWSIWQAADKKCYLCSNPIPDICTMQIDHLIPSSVGEKKFDEIMKRVAGGLPHFGMHHLYNLRCACTQCNSSALKGSKVMNDAILLFHFTNSAKLHEKVLGYQNSIFAKGEAADSLIKVLALSAGEHEEILWDCEINEDLISKLRGVSIKRLNVKSAWLEPVDSRMLFQFEISESARRLIAAFQLYIGATLREVLEIPLNNLEAALRDHATSLVVSEVPGFEPLDFNDVDLSDCKAQIGVDTMTDEWEGAALALSATISGGATVEFVQQSDDGGTLEDSFMDVIVDCEFVLENLLLSEFAYSYEVEWQEQ